MSRQHNKAAVGMLQPLSVVPAPWRSGGTITYTATPHDAGTTFEREFVYATPNRLLALLDRLVLRRRIEAESAEALRRLKTVLEGSDTRQPVPTQDPGRHDDQGR